VPLTPLADSSKVRKKTQPIPLPPPPPDAVVNRDKTLGQLYDERSIIINIGTYIQKAENRLEEQTDPVEKEDTIRELITLYKEIIQCRQNRQADIITNPNFISPDSSKRTQFNNHGKKMSVEQQRLERLRVELAKLVPSQSTGQTMQL
jgi:hypothetical protein